MYRQILRLLVFVGCAALAMAGPRVRIGVENNAQPLSFVDPQGRPPGFSADLLREVARAGSLDIEVVANSWSHILAEFRAGRLDALANVTILDERRSEMDFTIGHAYIHGVVYYRPDRPPLRHTAEFAGKRIAVLLGSIGHTNAVAHQGWGATIEVFPSWSSALAATKAGRCDAALFIRSLKAEMIQDQGMLSDFVEDIIYQFHIAVHKGDQRTLEALNEALATVRHDGTFDRIYARWIGPLEPRPIRFADLRPYYLSGAIGLLALAALFWWQRCMLARLARQAEALRESEARWKFAIEGAGDAVWDWNIASNTVAFSRRWAQMLGCAEDGISTQLAEWKNRIHPKDLPNVERALQDHLAGRTSGFVNEHRLRCQDGSYKWILGRGLVVNRDATGRPLRLIGTQADITGLKREEEDRLVMSKLESTGLLAAGIAHDFNNLLTTIMLNLELAQFDSGSSANFTRGIEESKKAVLAARDLTQQLITFAAGGTDLLQPTDLTQPIRESVSLALSGSSVRGEIALPTDLRWVVADREQFGQVIRNLLLNAREAMPLGGHVSVRAENVALHAGEIPPLSAGDYVRVSVSDQGGGIPAEVFPKIFDPYFSTKQRGAQKGMGLGLTICHSIVQRYGGAIKAESPPGSGAVFHVYLPAHQPAASAPPAEVATAARSGRILVMDDDVAVRDTLAKLLEFKGYEVEATADGKAAIESYAGAMKRAHPFDAVLLDLTVRGGMGGLETIGKLRALDPGVRAIVMSGYTNDAALREHVRHGFKAALVKPFSFETLKSSLDQILGRGAPPRDTNNSK